MPTLRVFTYLILSPSEMRRLGVSFHVWYFFFEIFGFCICVYTLFLFIDNFELLNTILGIRFCWTLIVVAGYFLGKIIHLNLSCNTLSLVLNFFLGSFGHLCCISLNWYFCFWSILCGHQLWIRLFLSFSLKLHWSDFSLHLVKDPIDLMFLQDGESLLVWKRSKRRGQVLAMAHEFKYLEIVEFICPPNWVVFVSL